jgi:hypothetical protein
MARFASPPFAIGYNECLRDVFAAGPDRLGKNVAGRHQCFLPGSMSVRQIRSLLIDDYLFTCTKNMKVEPAHFLPLPVFTKPLRWLVKSFARGLSAGWPTIKIMFASLRTTAGTQRQTFHPSN